MSLLHNTEVYKSLSEEKRVLHLLQWLQGLPDALKSAQKVSRVARARVVTVYVRGVRWGWWGGGEGSISDYNIIGYESILVTRERVESFINVVNH